MVRTERGADVTTTTTHQAVGYGRPTVDDLLDALDKWPGTAEITNMKIEDHQRDGVSWTLTARS